MSWKDDMIGNGRVRLRDIQAENSELVKKMRANDVEAEEILSTIKALDPRLKRASIDDIVAERDVPPEPPNGGGMAEPVQNKNNNKPPGATGRKIKKGVKGRAKKPSK